MSKILISLFALCLCASTASFAQGEFLRDNQSGLVIGGGTAFSSEENFKVVTLGLSLCRQLDFTVATGRGNRGNDGSYRAASATGWIMRQSNKGLLFSVGLSFGVAGQAHDPTALSTGVVFSRNFQVPQARLNLVPSLFFAQHFIPDASETALGFGGELGISYRVTGETRLIFSSGMERVEGETSGTLILGLLFGTSRKSHSDEW